MSDPNNNQYKSAFFTVPSHILDLPGLTLKFLMVFETIFQFWNHKKPCFLSDRAIMDRVGISKSQLHEAYSFFEKHGELQRKRKNDKRYLVQPVHWIDCEEIENRPTSAPADVEVRSSGLSTSAPADHNNKNLNKELNTTKTLVDFDKSTSYKDDVLFMLFYAIYPNKQKPHIAFKAFHKHKPTAKFVTMIVEDVKNRLANNWKNRPKDKIPFPSTYLNGREWEGEIYAPECNV